jgi:two-component system sensor histidine kinase YesM
METPTKIVNHLAKFYQSSLNMGHQYITLKEEIALTKHYLAIQHMRFDDSFMERWEVDESLLRPFVEIAINHAIDDDHRCLEIIIRVYRSMHDGVPALILEVEDDGCGMSSEQVETLLFAESKAGYGIKNVHEAGAACLRPTLRGNHSKSSRLGHKSDRHAAAAVEEKIAGRSL